MEAFSRVCGWVLAGVGFLLVLNAGAKLFGFAEFIEAVANYRLAPSGSEPWVAGTILLVETLIGLGMLLPRLRRRSSLLCMAMLLFFSMVVASSVMNGLDVECGCYGGGVSMTRIGWPLVVRNLGYIGFVLVALNGHLGPGSWLDDRAFRHLAQPEITWLALVLVLVLTGTFYVVQQGRSQGAPIAGGSGTARIQVGDRLEAFEGIPLDGRAVEQVAFGDWQETVIAIFSTKCPFCRSSVEAWNTAHDAGRRLVGVSLSPFDSTRRFVEEHDVRFPVVMPADRAAFARDYRAQKVPQTIGLDRGGKVLAVQHGQVSRVESAAVHLEGALGQQPTRE